MRYLGIDYGSKKVGLALSDEAGTMGFPHGILPHTRTLLGAIAKLIQKERVGIVIIGESKDYSGNDNPIAADARAFGTALMEHTGVPVRYEPEVLTTAEARRAQTPGAQVDDSAAALILTSYLSRRHE